MNDVTESPTPELTLIVTAHNRADIIEDTLESLANQDWADGTWDVVLVDNDSTDATPEILQRWAAKMPVAARVIAATEQHNLSYSRNVGAAATPAPSIAFLDDDDVIGAGYVAAIGNALRTSALVGPRHEHSLLNDASSARFRGNFQTTELGEVFGAPMVSGGGFACQRSLWTELDGQCEATGYGGEDVEFSLRANLIGVEPAFVEDAIYHVRLRGGMRSTFRQGRLFSLARVRLYREFGERFDQRPDSLTRLLRNWAGMILRLPSVRRPGPRLVWVWQLGRRVGHLHGSIATRTWYP